MFKKAIITRLLILFLPIVALWLFDDEDTEQVSAAGSQPQIIKFTSTTCSECKEMNKVFAQLLPKYQGQFKYKEIVVDRRSDMDNDLIRKYHVTLVPTVVMLNSDGSEYKTIVGAIPTYQMESFIRGLK